MKFVKVFSIACLASASCLASFIGLMIIRGGMSLTSLLVYVGLLGAIVGGLLYLGVDALLTFGRGEGGGEGSRLVLVRDREGRVLSVRGESRGFVVRGLSALKDGLSRQRRELEAARALKTGILALSVLEAYLAMALLLGTFTPVMVVPSWSMAPTLNVGDLIFVVGVDPASVSVGDIIVFNVPAPHDRYTPSPIVHRVVEVNVEDGEVYFRTKGDNNPSADAWKVPAGNLIGRYAGRIPYVGLPILFLRTPQGIAVAASLMLLWIFYPQIKRMIGGRR